MIRTCTMLMALALSLSAGVSGWLGAAEPAAKEPATGDPPGLTRLSPKYPVWVDKANKRVVMSGEICLRDGQMEMFACLKNTKEHESIVAVPTEAFIVHAGLIAVGAEPGNPAQFRPTYKPATGTEVDIDVYWTDDKGMRQHTKAENWLKNLKTNKPLDRAWVFGGSGFWVDPANGQRHYQAEEGDFICISNFSSAMLDLPIESSQSNAALMFEAITDKIPPKGTKVSLVLTPQLKDLPAERGGDPKVDLLEAPASKAPKSAN